MEHVVVGRAKSLGASFNGATKTPTLFVPYVCPCAMFHRSGSVNLPYFQLQEQIFPRQINSAKATNL